MTTCLVCGRHDDRDPSYHGGEVCAEIRRFAICTECKDAGHYFTTSGHIDRDDPQKIQQRLRQLQVELKEAQLTIRRLRRTQAKGADASWLGAYFGGIFL